MSNLKSDQQVLVFLIHWFVFAMFIDGFLHCLFDETLAQYIEHIETELSVWCFCWWIAEVVSNSSNLLHPWQDRRVS